MATPDVRPVPRPRISDEDALKMRRQYEGGAKPSLEDLERRWGWSVQAIRSAIVRVGGKMRPKHRVRRLPSADYLLTLSEGGMTRAQLAEYAGTGIPTIDGMLSRARKARREAMLARVALGPFGDARW